MKRITVEPLSKDNFKPYGDVIELQKQPSFTINNGMADRHHALTQVQTDTAGEAIISLIHSRQYSLPMQIKLVERHPLGSQAFIPLNNIPFIVVVASQEVTAESAETVRAFKTNGQQGINYRAGVWHGLLATPYGETTFACIDRSGPGDNCEEIHFGEQQQIMLDL